MARVSPKLEWCIVRLGNDMNWWVEEINDAINWDVDGLSIIDPKQINYIVDHLDQLAPYGFRINMVESAFIKFAIDKSLSKGRIRLVQTSGSFLAQDDTLFALPDIIDEDRGPYADFIYQLTRARVKMLNDVIDFEQQLTIDDLEEEIRGAQNMAAMEGIATHAFNEVMSILEYVPEGYELEEEEESSNTKEPLEEDFPDIEEDETLEQDETMRWGDEDEDTDEDSETEELPEENESPDEPKKKAKKSTRSKKK